MAKVQKYGIVYPFTNENLDNVYLDLNENYEDSIKSQILHIIFTPKGQKLRDPSFGTNLIRFIFDQSYEETFENIKADIREAISSRISDVDFKDITIYANEDNEHERYVNVQYGVKRGNVEIINDVAVKL